MFLASKCFGIAYLYAILVVTLAMLEVLANDGDKGATDVLVELGVRRNRNQTTNCDDDHCLGEGKALSGWIIVIIIIAAILILLLFLKVILSIRNCICFCILPSICQECIDKCMDEEP